MRNPLLALAFALTASGALAQSRLEVSFLSGASLLAAEATLNGEVCSECAVPLELRPFLPALPSFSISSRESLSRSALAGVRVSYSLAGPFAIEGGGEVEPGRRLRSEPVISCPPGAVCPLFVPRSIDVTFSSWEYDLGLRLSLGRRFLRPFLLGGVGAMAFDLPLGSKSDLAVTFGAGFVVGRGRLMGRLELNDDYLPHHFLADRGVHDLRLRGGIVLAP